MGHPRLSTRLAALGPRLTRALSGPHLLAFLPATSLGAFWLGGEGALTAVALGVPLLFALVGGLDSRAQVAALDPHAPVPAERLEMLLERRLAAAGPGGTILYQLEIDGFGDFAARHGYAAAETVLRRTADRLEGALRPGDLVLRMGESRARDARFAILPRPILQPGLDAAMALGRRLQAAVEEPVAIGDTIAYVSCCIGFTVRREASPGSGEELRKAAESALDAARRQGAGTLRAYTPESGDSAIDRPISAPEVAGAVEAGQIVAWFQPRISTDTGEINGAEAVPRWSHPLRGVIPPAEFLPLVDDPDMQSRLGAAMLTGALSALSAWDRAALGVERVTLRVRAVELLDPAFAERIAWELDRFDLAPSRLGIEVAETLVATGPDRASTRTLGALAALGCQIELGGFGTGNAKAEALRRFAVSRLKIDRSFVARCDRDPDQQRLIAAILAMAEQCGLDTVADGVESGGEHALLAQLGCGQVQGPGVAKPMPLEQSFEWIAAHRAGLEATPSIGRATG
ncbi:EAL domain-containing protein [Aquicoccus sp. SCR17]|nr:EAL domain-containing protein [Carideicomes alvinocaridis]